MYLKTSLSRTHIYLKNIYVKNFVIFLLKKVIIILYNTLENCKILKILLVNIKRTQEI